MTSIEAALEELETASTHADKTLEAAAKWIQKMGMQHGALKESLGIKDDETIPSELMTEIRSAVIPKGEKSVTIKNPSNMGNKEIAVDGQMKRRASLAKTLGKMNNKGD